LKIVLFYIALLLLSNRSFSQPPRQTDPTTEARLIPSEKVIYYRLGEKTIPVRILQYGKVNDPFYINLHDNESTSVEAAKSILELNGGALLKIENDHQRIIRFKLKSITYSFDPNRIFSREGIVQTLKLNKRISGQAIDEIEKFATRLLLFIPDSASCIIALHNNSDGAFSIRSYLPGNDKEMDAKAVYKDSLQDMDDLVFTTDRLLYQKMADQHYNTVWQDNKRALRDGSLSVYCGERNRRYINIETENGKFNQHREMLAKLIEVLREQ
jgi:hypothetical protein